MRKKLISAICGIVLAFTSCEKIKDAIETDSQIPTSIDFTINPVGVGTEQTIGEFEANLDLDALIKAHAPALSAKNIKSIKLVSFRIDLLDQDRENNFQAFKSASAKISAVGLPAREVVNISNYNPGTSSYSLFIPVVDGGLELKNYLNKPIKYTIKGETRSSITKSIRAKLNAQYLFVIGV